MTAPLTPMLTPVQAAAQATRRTQLTQLLNTLDDIRRELLLNPGNVSQLRRLAGASDHLRDLLRVPRAAVSVAAADAPAANAISSSEQEPATPKGKP